MSRAKAILQSEYPYNITARCINREWFTIPMSDVWKIFCDELNKVRDKKNLRIHSFVLMSNHFHLIASTPDSNISECMHQFMGGVSRRLTTAGNRINETFAGRHYKCILHQNNYYLNAYKYNYRNPVAVGLCVNAEDYPYSTLTGRIGRSRLIVNLEPDLLLDTQMNETLNWINTAPTDKRSEGVRFALKRQYFQSKKCPVTKKCLIGEHDTL